MVKKKDGPEEVEATEGKIEVVREEAARKDAVVAPEKPKVTPPAEVAKPVVPKPKKPSVPFTRWFNARGFKPHWKAGMAVYADTTGRRTMDEWDEIFSTY